ncbi:hypothetical protein MHYP_G00076310 [Metynnis hypsauchen]
MKFPCTAISLLLSTCSGRQPHVSLTGAVRRRVSHLRKGNELSAKVDFADIFVVEYDGSRYGGVSYEMAMDEMTVINGNNKVHHGISALGLGWLARFITLPLVRPLMGRLPGTD